jgi:hypothetical protein
VKAAVASGSLSGERLESYLKLREEMVELGIQQVKRLQIEAKRRARSKRQ